MDRVDRPGRSALYPQEKVDVQEHELQAVAKEFGLELQEAEAGIAASLTSLSETPNWKLARKRRLPGHVLPDDTRQGGASSSRPSDRWPCATGIRAGDIGIYIQPQHQGVSQHVEFSIPFNPANRSEVETVKAALQAASEALIARAHTFRGLTALGGPGLQPRRHGQPRSADGKANRGPESRHEPRQAVFLTG